MPNFNLALVGSYKDVMLADRIEVMGFAAFVSEEDTW